MSFRRSSFLVSAVVVALVATAVAAESPGEWSGFAAVESRGYAEDPGFAGQDSGSPTSLVFEPEYYRELAGGDQSLTFRPFARLDSVDDERTHFDIRELSWRRVERNWELLAGVSKVFWGVTESQHLVDIVNQTDLVENPDGEDKLGQPMVRLSLVRNWGIVDLFLLPGFRERTFPGADGRLRPPLPVDTEDAVYESSAGQEHVDYALRWSHAVGAFDLGLSWFEGTSREPLLTLSPTDTGTLVPYYEQVSQVGLDTQATLGNWLLKLEAVERSSRSSDFAATTAGLEYTFWGAFGSSLDLGVVAEHLWDERGELATSPFEDDTFLATRLAFNDTQSTEILAGAIFDNDGDGSQIVIEASRRIGSSWIVEAEMRAFSGNDPTDPFAFLRDDDFFQLSVQRHF